MMFPQFRLLHNIFATNVFPWKRNKIDLTLFTEKKLYHVGLGQPACLPSLLCTHIIYFAKSKRHNAHPFECVMSKIANLLDLHLEKVELEIVYPLGHNNVRFMKLQPFPHQVNRVPPDDPFSDQLDDQGAKLEQEQAKQYQEEEQNHHYQPQQ